MTEVAGAADRLFVLQVVVALEERWFAPDADERTAQPIKTERRYVIEQHLFSSANAEDAFQQAKSWLSSFSDMNHDGPGELSVMFAVGIHQLAEISSIKNLPRQLQDLYGVLLPHVNLQDVDEHGVPTIRSKEDLDVFL